MITQTILHIIPASGGGIERFARSISRSEASYSSARTHCFLHVGSTHAALEMPEQNRYALFELPKLEQKWPRFIAGLCASYEIDLLHCHVLTPVTVKLLASAKNYLISLHDVGFIASNAFEQTTPEPTVDYLWLAKCRRVLQRARAITAPSNYLQQLFQRHFPDLAAMVIEPGTAEPSELAPKKVLQKAWASHQKPRIGIVGAIGPHKGGDFLELLLQNEAARAFDWTVIGYTTQRIFPQHDPALGLTVHGPFAAEQTAALLEQYEIDLVYFPNRLAESFSYALSDVWHAGVPVLVPATGALFERCTKVQGGWVLRAPSDVNGVLSQMQEILAESNARNYQDVCAAIVANAAIAAPGLTAMMRKLTPLYAPDAPALDASGMPWSSVEVQDFLRHQLDGVVFRAENIRLARDYSQSKAYVETLTQQLDELADAKTQADAWSAKLEQDCSGFRARNLAIEADLSSLKQAADTLFLEKQNALHAHQALERANALVLAEVANLQAALTQSQAHIALLQQQAIAAQHSFDAEQHRLTEEINALAPRARRYDKLAALIPAPIKSAIRFLVRR
jgi:glycosyltransferase involved in cell wall biosynthesis